MVHGSSKIATYLNTHPMFKTGEYGRCTAVPDFFNYYERYYEGRKGKNSRFWKKMDNAIWYTSDFHRITKADCDKFFKEIIEPLWCQFYNVKSSGFFEAQLPAVPKGLLSIPANIC
jgi:hypothetical protein